MIRKNVEVRQVSATSCDATVSWHFYRLEDLIKAKRIIEAKLFCTAGSVGLRFGLQLGDVFVPPKVQNFSQVGPTKKSAGQQFEPAGDL